MRFPRLRLRDPEIVGLDAYSPADCRAIRRAISRKGLLRRFQENCAAELLAGFAPPQRVIELGGGQTPLSLHFPWVCSTDVLAFPDVRMQCSGLALPLREGSIDGFVMRDVFHHVPDAQVFLKELSRGLKPGGIIRMIEPACTPLSRIIYGFLHHEPFCPAGDWTLPPPIRKNSANSALPWIVFQRDRTLFHERFPELHLMRMACLPPLTFLLSGGISYRSLLPGMLVDMVCQVERRLAPLNPWWGLLMIIELKKTSKPSNKENPAQGG